MKTLYSAEGLELTGELTKYANGKSAHLARKIPRRLRSKAACKVSFGQTASSEHKLNTCRIVLTLDDTELRAEETTQHMYAALDIAAVHIEQQLAEYIHTHRRQGLFRRHKFAE